MGKSIVLIEYFNRRNSTLLEVVDDFEEAKRAVEEVKILEVLVMRGYLVTEFVDGYPVRASSYSVRLGDNGPNEKPDWQDEPVPSPYQQCWQGTRRVIKEEKR